MIQVLVPSPALDVTYLVDDFQLGGIDRPAVALHQAGGKGLNLARAALRLGLTVRVVTALGGRTGARVAELAAGEGISIRDAGGSEETRLCISIIGNEITEVYEHPPAIELDRLAGAADGGPLVISGRVHGDSMASIAAYAVDTSGPALLAFIESGVRVVKVNSAEAAEAMRSDASALDLARGIHARGVAVAVVTDGARGSAAVAASGEWLAAPDPEPGRFTVGSGDSFFAGLLAGLERTLPMQEALSLAAAAGSANSRRPGAGVFEAADLDQALGRIRVLPV